MILTTMPTGKYKGKPVRDIPVEYLRWAEVNLRLPYRVLNSIHKILYNMTTSQLLVLEQIAEDQAWEEWNLKR